MKDINLSVENKATLRKLYELGYDLDGIEKLDKMIVDIGKKSGITVDFGLATHKAIIVTGVKKYRSEYFVGVDTLPYVIQYIDMMFNKVDKNAINNYISYELGLTNLDIKGNDFYRKINPYIYNIFEDCEFDRKPSKPKPVPEIKPCPPCPIIPTLDSDPYVFKYRNVNGIVSINGFDWDYINSMSGLLPSPLVISPRTPNDEAVNSVGIDAFYKQSIGRDVIIPEPISDVSSRYLFRETGITGITFNDNISGSMGTFAFYANSLDIVKIPRRVTRIENSCFGGSGINKLDFSSNSELIYIGGNAFIANNLKSVSLPNKLTTIGTYAFKDNSLTDVNLNNGLKSIGVGAFGGNNISKMSLPDSIENIGERAFEGNNMKYIKLPKNIKSMGNYVFQDNALEAVDIGSGLINMFHGMLSNNRIKEVIIPNQVRIVRGLDGNLIEYLDIPGTVREVYDVNNNIVMTHIDLHDGVEIFDGIFRGCDTLQHVRIPDSIKTITKAPYFEYSYEYTRTIYANLMPGDKSNADGTEFTIRGQKFKKGSRRDWVLKPLSEFPRDESRTYQY